MSLQAKLDLKGSIERKIGTPWQLVKATDPVTQWEEENVSLPSHFRDYKKASMEDSNFGSLSCQGCLLIDLFHRYDPESFQQARFDIFESNARSDRLKGDSDKVSEYIEKRTEVIHKNMLENFSFKSVLLGGEPVPEEAYRPEGTELWEVAKRMAYSKFAFGTYRSYVVESYVKDDLEEMGVGPVLADSTEIEKYVSLEKPDGGTYDSAESAGIDLYLPEEDTAIQVKEGRGGKTDDESTVIARLIHEDIPEPQVHYSDNKTD